jgi:histidine ammonia-lyase
MGMTSAIKLRTIVDIAEMASAIEFLTAAQALEFRQPLTPGRGVKRAYDIVRANVQPTERDRSMSEDINKIVDVIKSDSFAELLD